MLNLRKIADALSRMFGGKRRKVFVLGVGAQKSGTTWLHNYLHRHPRTAMGFSKEYHVFDALYIPACRKMYTRRFERGMAILKSGVIPRTNLFRYFDFFQNIDNYFDFFQSLANKDSRTILTGDITPSYAALPVDVLKMIRTKLIERGFSVKVVFIMRDPVDRCTSAMRMAFRNRGIKPDKAKEERALRAMYRTESYEIRTRYDQTIRNLEAVFAPHEIHYQFYERLFTREAIVDLCKFLEIPFREPKLDKKMNVSRTENEIDPALLREIYQHYGDVYAGVRARFGAATVDAMWKRH